MMLEMWVMLAGAVAGGGVMLAAVLVAQPPTTGPVGLARFDEQLRRGRRTATLTADRRHQGESARMRKIGSDLAEALDSRGIRLPKSLTVQLGLVGMSREMFLARTVGGALLGFLWPVFVVVPMAFLGVVAPIVPLWGMVLGAVVGAMVPSSQLRTQAAERLRAFRHMLSAFLDLVAMNLAGGRGVPEALQAAASISDSEAMVRIRDTLEAAKLQGVTPWAALGELGDEIDLDELRDLAASLALVAEDGAKVRESLAARAASMRSKELADAEGRAAAKSQSMLVAQLLMCVGFLLFLIYPALAMVLV
ncbi:type II secretion system F family protein [Nocardioides jishulii]|nr:type II secretion system F family protein [Nocardioides jishulii]